MESIDIFPWNDNFNTGIGIIDEQHARLVELINKLASHVAFQSDIPALNVIFDELADYAVYHFSTEEAIWNEHLGDDATNVAHKEVHDTFLASVTRLKNGQGDASASGVVEDVLSFLTRWLASHILENDRYMAALVLAMQTGLSVEAAKQHARDKMGGSTKVLIEIILSIYENLSTNTLHLMRELGERRQTQQQLSSAHAAQLESLERIQALMDASQDAIISMGQDGAIIDWNAQAVAIFGYTAEQAKGLLVGALARPCPAMLAPNMAGGASAKPLAQELTGIRRDGSEFPIEVTMASIEQQGRCLCSAYIRDISDRKAALEKIEQLAYYDPLTQLPNRRLLSDRLQQALASSVRSKRQGAVLLVDLDNFKTINETLGHAVGDLLLKQVAQRLLSCVREGDTVARPVGDEFFITLKDLREDLLEAAQQAEGIGSKILTTLSEPYLLDGHAYRSTPSIGITLFQNWQSTVEELLKQADIAMHQAKKVGRKTMRFFDPKMQEAITARVGIEEELRLALARDEFCLYYQPQVDDANRVIGAEALIRWVHPTRGVVPPVQFIPLAEENDMILPIGQWVLQTACAQIAQWAKTPRTRDLMLSVNVSAKQFHQTDFVASVRTAVDQAGIDPTRIKLELTEGMLLQSVDETIACMNALNRIGIQFSLDDFGTGYSSLQYLKRLPLDQIKIDQSFVRDIATDSSDQAIVRTIIAMAKSLELDVIAEGVETQEQRKLLLHKGCQQFQGYLFGRPVPVEQFDKTLAAGC